MKLDPDRFGNLIIDGDFAGFYFNGYYLLAGCKVAKNN